MRGWHHAKVPAGTAELALSLSGDSIFSKHCEIESRAYGRSVGTSLEQVSASLPKAQPTASLHILGRINNLSLALRLAACSTPFKCSSAVCN